ncbi:MAG TPA: hypothetical protein VMX74_13555 [Pirellulales bacterium]|nr:hypothetical protein [Pirellulales bacterium]
MTERKTETIEIGQGINYAKVAARSAEFHKDNETCSIETSCEFKEGYALFTAKVTTKKGTFTGHSMDKVGGRQKQFEKQETIAVGRALAFAGYLSSGEIATYEEMADLEDMVTTAQLNGLKVKFASEYSELLEGLDRGARQQRFNAWCLALFEDEVNYNDVGSWSREWYDAAWKQLIGVTSDVPFDEE